MSGIGIKNFLNQAVADIKLVVPLKAVFPDSWERILTYAYYPVSGGDAFERMTGNKKFFFGGIFSSQRISELIVRIAPSCSSISLSNGWDEPPKRLLCSVSLYNEFIDFVN